MRNFVVASILVVSLLSGLTVSAVEAKPVRSGSSRYLHHLNFAVFQYQRELRVGVQPPPRVERARQAAGFLGIHSSGTASLEGMGHLSDRNDARGAAKVLVEYLGPRGARAFAHELVRSRLNAVKSLRLRLRSGESLPDEIDRTMVQRFGVERLVKRRTNELRASQIQLKFVRSLSK